MMQGSFRTFRSIRTLVIAAVLAGSILPAGGALAAPGNGREAPVIPGAERPIAGQYIVVLNEGANPRSVAAAAGVNPRYVYTSALNGFSATLNKGQLTALQQNRNVDYIEQDQEVSLSATQTSATWGLDRIDQRALPLSGTYTYTSTGAGVKAYIIDTGILTGHGEFGGRAVTGFDAVTTNGSAVDCNGHGTHVAGTVGGADYGVAKGVTLVAVRVLDCGGSGTWGGVIAGIDWVTGDHAAGAPAVANMSLGGGGNTSVDTAVKNMIADGVATAVAAGNGNMVGIAQDACRTSPARVPEAMTISATDSNDRKASWANYGKCVDWFAPGVAIKAAWFTGDSDTNTISGTSMATPHTAGVAALYLQGKTGPAASPAAVRTALYDNTTKGIVTSSKTGNNHLLFTNY